MRWCPVLPWCSGCRLALCCTAAATLACSAEVLAPTIDCDGAVGALFVEVSSSGSLSSGQITVNVGDSVHVATSLRQVDKSDEAFNVQVGWYCQTVESSAVPGVVMLSTADTSVVRIAPTGWIRGRAQGAALVSASAADSTVSPTFFTVLVHSP